MADQRESLQLFMSLLIRKNDVTLICEGREIHASKSVLFNSCPYFEGLLSGSFPEGKGKVIKIENTSFDILTVVVNYACFKQFMVKDWDIDKWKQLLWTAHEYNFKDLLKHASEAFDVDQFDLWSLVKAFPWFIKLELETVLTKIWLLVDGYAVELVDQYKRGWFCALSEEFIKSFVQRETLHVSEAALLDSIAAWLAKNENVDNDILNHIHWNEISDKDPRKELWLGWSKDTSYKDKKPRCFSVPQTLEHKFILLDCNVAQFVTQFGASEAILQVSKDAFSLPRQKEHEVSLARPFGINTIKFRLDTSKPHSYKVEVYTAERQRVDVTPASPSGSFQEIYFEPKIVTEIYIMTNTGVNSFECMYSTNMPTLRDSHIVAKKNMLLSTNEIQDSDKIVSLQHIEYSLKQRCYVSSMALYFRRDRQFNFEIFNFDKQITITDRSVTQDGGLKVVLLQFPEMLLDTVTVKSKDGIIHIVKAECPAPQPLIDKVNWIPIRVNDRIDMW